MGSVTPLLALGSRIADVNLFAYLAAFGGGVVSFLSPCVLPLVPAYLGQLTAVAVAAHEGGSPSRWAAVRHAFAYVAGFGTVFTLLGVTAAFAGGAMADFIQPLRIAGGVVLIVMGLSLAGILRVPFLERTWRPLDAGASAGLTSLTGGMTLAPAGGAGGGGGLGGRMGRRMLAGRAGLGAAFALGGIFAIGWTPCIGIVLGGILTLAASSQTSLQGALLLIAYTAGLGIPFLLIAMFYDRAPAAMRPLVRHGRLVSLVGGLLVVAIGVAMVFDLLVLLPRWFQFTSFV
jgi:cytochrome c-type biogenesis protein